MKKFLVVMGEGSATVTADCMIAGDGFVRFFGPGDEHTEFEPACIACFSQHNVVSVVEKEDPKAVVIEEAPELPTLGRWYPVYAYGKGDLAEALRRARDMCNGKYGQEAMRQGAGSYLNDILRDLHKGK